MKNSKQNFALNFTVKTPIGIKADWLKEEAKWYKVQSILSNDLLQCYFLMHDKTYAYYHKKLRIQSVTSFNNWHQGFS